MQDYPDYASWQYIGQAWGKSRQQPGYELYVLKLTQSNGLQDKPVLLINSALHAREYATAPLSLAFAKKLLAGIGNDADIDWILERQEIHLILHSNPEGRKIAETGLLWRKNANNDECQNSTFGIDLNRNFSFSWFTTPTGSSGNSCSQVYRGILAASEPETQAIEQYIRSIFPDRRGPLPTDAAPADTAGIHLDIHSYSELILWPWGDTSTPAPNGPALQTLGRKLAWFNNYFPTQSIGLYPTDGTSDDPSYGELGVAALTFEIGTAFFQPCSSYYNQVLPDNLKALMYAARVTSAPYLLPSGPEVQDLQLNTQQGKLALGEPLQINFTLSDQQSSQLNGVEPSYPIQRAELYLNEYPDIGVTPLLLLQAKDGYFDTPVEQVTGTITGLPLGKHRIYVRGQDASGQHGPVYAHYVDVIEAEGSPLQKLEFSIECEFLRCNFQNTSVFEPDPALTFTWQIDDDHNSQQPSTTYTYPTPGLYSVSLTANWHEQSTSVSNEFHVYAQPSANFTAECQELRCEFNATASSANGSITSYHWSQAGQEGTGNPWVHTFAAAGNYSIRLVVTDNANQQTQIEHLTSVTAPLPEAKSGGSWSGYMLILLAPMLWLRRALITHRQRSPFCRTHRLAGIGF